MDDAFIDVTKQIAERYEETPGRKEADTIRSASLMCTAVVYY